MADTENAGTELIGTELVGTELVPTEVPLVDTAPVVRPTQRRHPSSAPTPVTRLQQLMRLETVWSDDPETRQFGAFDEFVDAVAQLYPLVHSRMTRAVFAGHTIVYTWPGRSPEEPTVLVAHYDVAPADEAGWKHPPFAAESSGRDDEQVLWGRGAVAAKGPLAAMLEAVQWQLETGMVPAKDIVLVLGHDGESGGAGLAAFAAALERRGVRPGLVLDEGGAIVEQPMPAVRGSLALVGVAEKGQTVARLTVDDRGGHAAAPPRVSASARLARAVTRISFHRFPASFSSPVLGMLRALGDRSAGPTGWALNHLRLTRRLVAARIGRSSPELDAQLRTTAAVTTLAAGRSLDSIPERATATVIVRTAVDATEGRTMAILGRVVRDRAVRIDVLRSGEPSAASPTSGLVWELLRSTIEKSFPGVAVVPSVYTGATGSRWLSALTRSTYRFTPFELSPQERAAVRGRNERIPVETYLAGIEFYKALVSAL